MPSFKGQLSEEQIQAVAKFVGGQRRQVARAAPPSYAIVEIDDDVRHRHVEALAGVLDDALLEPVRAARRDASR